MKLFIIRNHLGMANTNISCTGFSMGAYHAANFFFKHPDQFDTVIAISGFYNLKMLVVMKLMTSFISTHLIFFWKILRIRKSWTSCGTAKLLFAQAEVRGKRRCFRDANPKNYSGTEKHLLFPRTSAWANNNFAVPQLVQDFLILKFFRKRLGELK